MFSAERVAAIQAKAAEVHQKSAAAVRQTNQHYPVSYREPSGRYVTRQPNGTITPLSFNRS